MIKTFIATTIPLLLINTAPALHGGDTETYDFTSVTDPARWSLINVDAESNVDGKTAIHLGCQGDSDNGIAGLASPVGLKFTTGVIEVDLKKARVSETNSFLGIAFNVTDANKFEAIYFRPFNSTSIRPSVSVASSTFRPGNSWELLRKTYQTRLKTASRTCQTLTTGFTRASKSPRSRSSRFRQCRASTKPGGDEIGGG
ncbi:MAG: hypothetical protein IPP41_11865 [Rhodocyclaceae bacterium]|nr:hypothetical protein [Rhodocyclaceae bacterium]